MLLTATHVFCLCAGFWLRTGNTKPLTAEKPQISSGETKVSLTLVRDEFGGRLATIESRLSTLEPQVRWISESRALLAPAAPGGNKLEMAGKLAKCGTSVDELMEICDLGRGEAELIRTLNAVEDGNSTDSRLTS